MNQAEIVSRGEYFCAKLMAEYLGYGFVDAKDIIRFRLDKTIDWQATTNKLTAKCAQYKNFVFPVSMEAVPMDKSKFFLEVVEILPELYWHDV